MGFKAGDTVFIVESNRFIREAEVRSCTGGIYLIQFKDNGVGDVGIPAFVFEDGRISIDPADAGLIEYGTPDACSIDDHKSGRKGC